MKAHETKLLTLLQGPKQFMIPIYQRTYSWSRKECGQLLKDTERAGRNAQVKGHFVGSVVYIQRGLYHATTTQPLLVIDGQQRMTTISLLIACLAEAAEAARLERALADLVHVAYGLTEANLDLMFAQSRPACRSRHWSSLGCAWRVAASDVSCCWEGHRGQAITAKPIAGRGGRDPDLPQVRGHRLPVPPARRRLRRRDRRDSRAARSNDG